VCTIHQPSTVIFEAFESLLLLRRGGQTVFFGELGEKGANLVSYFEAIPGIEPMPKGTNPATWMLECIGAGTSAATITTDFHGVYTQSALCDVNTTKVNVLCPEDEAALASGIFRSSKRDLAQVGKKHYNASYWVQFKVLMWRISLSFWRSPTYNFGRIFSSIIIALIFASAYIDQKYSSDVDCISRVALIYMTTLFVGVIGMMSVQPVMFAERPAFYREQFSDIYDVKLYTLALTLVEVPYLLISSVCFLIPYFWLVGFDKGPVADKFFWYWLYEALFCSVMVYLGHLLTCILPNAETAQVMGGMVITLFTLFCGFMIVPADFPDFWIFMYWVNPIHYVLEGIITTQFNGDETLVTITGSTDVVTANTFISDFYADFRYSARGYDIMALCLFLIILRYGTYLTLEHVRFDKR